MLRFGETWCVIIRRMCWFTQPCLPKASPLLNPQGSWDFHRHLASTPSLLYCVCRSLMPCHKSNHACFQLGWEEYEELKTMGDFPWRSTDNASQNMAYPTLCGFMWKRKSCIRLPFLFQKVGREIFTRKLILSVKPSQGTSCFRRGLHVSLWAWACKPMYAKGTRT